MLNSLTQRPGALLLSLSVLLLSASYAMAQHVVKHVVARHVVVHRVMVSHPGVVHGAIVHHGRYVRERVVRHGRLIVPRRPHPVVVAPGPVQHDWGIAARVGDANWVRDEPNHKGHIIEKIMQGTRFRVIGQAPDPFGTVYFHVALPDGKVGWLDHVCVRFPR